MGKSLVLIDLISRVSRGTPFPADNTIRDARAGRIDRMSPTPVSDDDWTDDGMNATATMDGAMDGIPLRDSSTA